MKEIADDIHLLSGWPPNAINVYLVGERRQPGCVLIDAATRQAERRIFKQLAGRTLSALLTGVTGLHEPPNFFNVDSAQNRASIRRLAALRPALVCFGHGPPLRDPDKLADFAAGLPA